MCFGNQFSMFAHKTVFMSLDIGSITPKNVDAYSYSGEEALVETHKHLNYILDSLIHRLLVSFNYYYLLERQTNSNVNANIFTFSMF